MHCHNCQQDSPLSHKPGRNDYCQHCSSPLRCCLNCRFYDALAHHQCREPQAEWVSDKKAANFCDYFEATGSGSAMPDTQRADDARRKLAALFGDAPEADDPA